jgi:hypothetical protein
VLHRTGIDVDACWVTGRIANVSHVIHNVVKKRDPLTFEKASSSSGTNTSHQSSQPYGVASSVDDNNRKPISVINESFKMRIEKVHLIPSAFEVIPSCAFSLTNIAFESCHLPTPEKVLL